MNVRQIYYILKGEEEEEEEEEEDVLLVNICSLLSIYHIFSEKESCRRIKNRHDR